MNVFSLIRAFKEYYHNYLDHFTENQEMKDNPSLLLEMPNLSPVQTGIKNVSVYVSQRPTNRQHRVMVTIGGNHFRVEDNVSVVLTGRPMVVSRYKPNFEMSLNQFAIILKWHSDNSLLFRKFWNGEINADQFEAQVRPFDHTWQGYEDE